MIIQTFYFFLSITLFYSAPTIYSNQFCLLITVIFLGQSIPFIIQKSKGNYVNFYSIFFVAYFFTNFIYPTIVFPIDPEFYSVFSLPFNDNFINKGTALAQVLSSSFILGASSTMLKLRRFNNEMNQIQYYTYQPIIILSSILFIIFLITVGNDFLSGNFIGQTSISFYILRILTSTIFLGSILYFKTYHLSDKKNLFIVLSASFILLFFLIGDRGPGIYLTILILGLYSFYIKRIPKYLLILLFITGVFSMHLIGLGRTTDAEEAEGLILNRGLTEFEENLDSIWYLEILRGFVVNNRNLYVALEYVENEGLNYGETMVTSALGIIPFAQSTVETVFNQRFITSARFFTELTFGRFPPYGLGTNLIADIYIAFGILGVVLLPFFAGYYIQILMINIKRNPNNYNEIIYFTLLAYSVYLPRTHFLMPLSFIVYSIVTFIIFKKTKLLKPIKG